MAVRLALLHVASTTLLVLVLGLVTLLRCGLDLVNAHWPALMRRAAAAETRNQLALMPAQRRPGLSGASEMDAAGATSS